MGVLHCSSQCMEQPKAPNEKPPKRRPEHLDLSDRDPSEPATIEDIERLRHEIDYKLALLLDLQIDAIQRPPSARERMTWQKKIGLASEIGYQNFLDHVLWHHAQARAKDLPSGRPKPDQGAWPSEI